MGEARMGRDRKGFKKSPDIDLGFLGEHVGFQVHIARRALRQAMRAFRSTDEALGGRAPPPSGTMSSLALIGFNPGISQQEIAASLFLDPSKATLLIKNLVSASLIKKRRAPGDRRRVALFLTEQGREMLQQVGTLSAAQESRIGRGLSPRERGQLVALLIKLQDTLR
jgi:DNA-binding MarR family transcriptional regulator